MASSGGFVVLLLLSLPAVALLASASEPLNPEGNAANAFWPALAAAPPSSTRLHALLGGFFFFPAADSFPRLGRELFRVQCRR